MFRQEAYIGTFWFHRGKPDAIAIPVPAILDQETFDRATVQATHNSVFHRGRPSREYLLTGLLRCRRCGHRCRTEPNSGHPRYICGNYERHPFRRFCEAPRISQRKLEETVWNAVWDVLSDSKMLYGLMRETHAAEEKTTIGSGRDALVKRIARAKRTAAAAFELMLDGDLEPEKRAAAKRAHLAAEAQRKEAEATLRAAQIAVLPSRDEVAEMCEEFVTGRDEITRFEAKREFLETVVDHVLVDAPDMEIHCRLEQPATAAGSEGPGKCNGALGPYAIFRAPISFVIKRRVA